MNGLLAPLDAGASMLQQQQRALAALQQRAMQGGMGGGGPHMQQPPTQPVDLSRLYQQQANGFGGMGMGGQKGSLSGLGGLLSNDSQKGMFDTFGLLGSQGPLFGSPVGVNAAWAPSIASVGPFAAEAGAGAAGAGSGILAGMSEIAQLAPFLLI